MKRFLATVFLALTAATANAITYHLDRVIGDGTVTGTITTDGTMGVLNAGNILDWSLTLAAPNINNDRPDTIAKAAGDTFLRGSPVTAEGAFLWYDFSLDSGTARGDYFYLAGNSGNFWCLETSVCIDDTERGEGPLELVEQMGTNQASAWPVAQFVQYTSQDKIAFATAVIPVPAAVWLFGSGLLGLFGLARIRR